MVRVARSGRRHKIGKQHILAAMRSAGRPTRLGDQLHYLAEDDRGVELHVVAVPDDRRTHGLVVIHAMPTMLRTAKEVRDDG